MVLSAAGTSDTTSALVAAPVATPAASVVYPGNVTVTPTQIITESDTIPRFVTSATRTSIRSGTWNNPSTWSGGRVPVAGDSVVVAAGMTINYASVSDVHIKSLEIDGTLNFSTTGNTRLIAGNIEVMPTGTLQIGTAAAPLPANLKAELVIADQALDLVKDPSQYGTGLIVLGTINLHGAAPSATWTSLGAEPHAGDTTLTLASSPTGWQAGSTLLLPDTRERQTGAFQWEEVTIDHVQGNQVFLTKPLAYDHLGAHNTSGGLELLPDVALLNRNVVIRSENPNGTRGHTMFLARASVDIEYVRFQDLGRTDSLRPLDNTTYNADGTVKHVGTNQIGRYAVHFHHVMGPVNPTNTGYQFQFVGNTIDGFRKWGLAVHESSFGLIDKNVVYNGEGAGIVTEEGNEINNVFSNNFVMRVQGTGDDGKTGTLEDDYGNGGSGFWFRRGGNIVTGNVATDTSFADFVMDGYYSLSAMAYPNFRGADPENPSQVTMSVMSPSTVWTDNEAYGLGLYGLWSAFPEGDTGGVNGARTVLFQNFRIWNITNSAVDIYYTSNVTFDNLLVLGDPKWQTADEGMVGMFLRTYANDYLTIQNSRIEGARYGIKAPMGDASVAGNLQPTIVKDSTLTNYINILVSPSMDYDSNGNALEVRDVKFKLMPLNGPNPISKIDPSANIDMQLAISRDLTNPYPQVALTNASVVKVFDYNGVSGDNFQVFYTQQVASFIMPQTSAALLAGNANGTIGSPEAGLTNAQNWSKYKIAVAGGIAPANATTRAGISGLVAPIQNPSSSPPELVIVTPWNNAQVAGAQPVRVRFNINGTLPAGALAYFSLDAVTLKASNADVYFSPSVGWHTIAGTLRDATGAPLLGTVLQTVTFYYAGPSGSPNFANAVVSGMSTPGQTDSGSGTTPSGSTPAGTSTGTGSGTDSNGSGTTTQSPSSDQAPLQGFGDGIAAALEALAQALASGDVDLDSLAQDSE